ncbi:hypothetical protein NN561_019118 [Cricetulus griseus]
MGARLQPTAPLHPHPPRDKPRTDSLQQHGASADSGLLDLGASRAAAVGVPEASGATELALLGLGARRSEAAETSAAGWAVTALANAARLAGWVQPRSPPSARPSRHSLGGGRRRERKVSLRLQRAAQSDAGQGQSPPVGGVETWV